jgi:hypothetical protein
MLKESPPPRDTPQTDVKEPRSVGRGWLAFVLEH